MRVFYIDEEEEEKSKRTYYVKMNNMNVPDSLKGFKAIKAASIKELSERVIEYYGLNDKPGISVQFWTNSNFAGKRVDTLKEIPEENEFIWIKVVLNKNE